MAAHPHRHDLATDPRSNVRERVFLDPRALAADLGGKARGDRVYAPGPGHSRHDRSLSILIDPAAPDGFLVTSFSGDDWAAARDYVRLQAGLPAFSSERREPTAQERAEWARKRADTERAEAASQAWRSRKAADIWREEAKPIAGTVAEAYLRMRLNGTPVPADVIEVDALRFHPECPFRVGEQTIRLPSMVAAMRDVRTGDLRAVHRTALMPDGSDKATMPDGSNPKKMLGLAEGTAIKLTADEDVTTGLGLAEGIETALTLIAANWRPIWATGSALGIDRFPALSGIESLTIFADADLNGVGQKAAQQCAERWQNAGREWTIIKPCQAGADWNDVTRSAA